MCQHYLDSLLAFTAAAFSAVVIANALAELRGKEAAR
jgi:hypothetical protein